MLQLDDVHVTFNAGRPTEVRALRGVSLAVAPGVPAVSWEKFLGKALPDRRKEIINKQSTVIWMLQADILMNNFHPAKL